MKTNVWTLACLLTIGSASFAPCRASDPSPEAIVMDTLLARPACLVATVAGSAAFLVSWPIAAISKSVKPCYNALVVKPAKATFTRPLGDLDGIMD